MKRFYQQEKIVDDSNSWLNEPSIGCWLAETERGRGETTGEFVLFSLRIASWDFALAGHSQSESISDLLKIHYRSFHIQMADDRQTYGHLDPIPQST